jgi:hypothetical protein
MRLTRSIFGFLILLLAACQRDTAVYTINTPGGTPVSSIISIKSLSALQVEADSATAFEIAVQINPSTDSVDRPLIFTTTNGTFLNRGKSDTILPDAYGVATTSIVSNTPGPAKLSANLQSYIVDTLIEFIPALPDNMLLVSSKYAPTPTDTVTLNCQVFRNIGRGKVTDPVTITFQQHPATAPGQGLVFLPLATTSNGKATLMVFNPYQITGTFELVANTAADNGNAIADSVTLVIK